MPDWAVVHQELKSGKNVTLQLLWEEYKRSYPQGYAYSWYCERYREWKRKRDLVMRQEHRAGEKMFVDHAGQTVPVIDPQTGEARAAYIFVAVLGASSYFYAEATWTRGLGDWIHSHVHAFEFFQGTTQIVVPDNWKSAVQSLCFYEPELNRTYNDLAIHYQVAIMPARPYRPKDKAKAEVCVQIVQRWILAALRKRQFFSLTELNLAMGELIHKANRKSFRKGPGSRAQLYESLDRPVLKPLPAEPFVFAEWKKARVNVDYHVELDFHYYSTPYQLVGEEVEVRTTATTVEIFYHGKRIASHARSNKPRKHTTINEHRPHSHQQYLEWTPSRITGWAATVGSFTARLVEALMAAKPHAEMAYRSALGVIRLSDRYGKERMEAACARALHLKVCSYKSVKSILERGLDRQPLLESHPSSPPQAHGNVRGPDYYAPTENKPGVDQC